MNQSIVHSEEYEPDQVQGIYVNCRVAHIRITGYSGSNICVKWHETQYRKMKTGITNGLLNITEEDSTAFYELFGFLEMLNGSDYLKELIIEIPHDFAGSKIVLNTQVNGVLVDSLSFDGTLEIYTKVREIMLENVNAGRIHIKTDSGQIITRNVAVQNAIKLNTTTGNVLCEIADNPDNYTIQCSTRVGKCTAPHYGGDGRKSIKASAETGNISISFVPCMA